VPPISVRNLDADKVQIGLASDLSAEQQAQLKADLMMFHPWRKGPYDLFGIHVDTEWRSDWKWERLKDHISPLKYRTVLDVGCGNGYHCWRMLGAGAKRVIGIDPTLISVMQFHLIKKMYGESAPIDVLPVGIEQLPFGMKAFDTVFSMGVLYHRRSPIDHLLELREALKSGGELVLETLVIEGGLGGTLLPKDRYAKMRNVWFLPSCETLISWLERCGFKNIRLVNVCKTTIEEQRTTEWMTFYSLPNFLDPHNPDLTCEGLPAPMRAIVIADAD
jgi:tRNA (mo5U34)-methyltransferase